MGLKYCDKCQEPVEQIVMVCPKCKSEMFVHGKASTPKTTSVETKVVPTPKADSKSTPPDSFPGLSKTGKTIDDLIRAQNRTTHAVRAFVRFLFIQLTGITCAVFLWNVSLAMNGNTSIEFVAGVVWLGAVIWSSAAGWDELNKSNVN
jgi:DNA-directed RNA polymerase subunit RPC12/RpoP